MKFVFLLPFMFSVFNLLTFLIYLGYFFLKFQNHFVHLLVVANRINSFLIIFRICQHDF